MSADDLREIIREMLLELDEQAHGRAIASIIRRAARNGSGWAPAPVSDEVAEAVAFATVAQRLGHAEPSEVDEHLRRAMGAFLRKDYAAAHQILGTLLRPICNGDIDLGQHEMVDEVLGADTVECAAQYVVSAYMISLPPARADAVCAAIEEVRGVGHFWEPIRAMERAAVEPLPGLDTFLPQWRDLAVRKSADERTSEWDTEEDRWLREVVQRLEGSDGLAKIARSTRRADDLRAWCRTLVAAGDWKGALESFEEAARLVADKEYVRGEFLDGAAQAAQQLGGDDLAGRLERAWRAGPSMLRLRRWLGSASTAPALLQRAAQALDSCPRHAARQRAFLRVLQGDFEPAAKLLAAAPGLGWSDGEHPGHLLFSLFTRLLGGPNATSPRPDLLAQEEMETEELGSTTGDDRELRLAAPEIDQILRRVGIDGISDVAVRGAALAAMRKAAESRLAGVTGQQRRHSYRHAAHLVAARVGCEPSAESAAWVATLRAEYRRFPALSAELDRALGSS